MNDIKIVFCEYIEILNTFDMLIRFFMLRKVANFLFFETEIDYIMRDH